MSGGGGGSGSPYTGQQREIQQGFLEWLRPELGQPAEPYPGQLTYQAPLWGNLFGAPASKGAASPPPVTQPGVGSKGGAGGAQAPSAPTAPPQEGTVQLPMPLEPKDGGAQPPGPNIHPEAFVGGEAPLPEIDAGLGAPAAPAPLADTGWSHRAWREARSGGDYGYGGGGGGGGTGGGGGGTGGGGTGGGTGGGGGGGDEEEIELPSPTGGTLPDPEQYPLPEGTTQDNPYAQFFGQYGDALGAMLTGQEMPGVREAAGERFGTILEPQMQRFEQRVMPAVLGQQAQGGTFGTGAATRSRERMGTDFLTNVQGQEAQYIQDALNTAKQQAMGGMSSALQGGQFMAGLAGQQQQYGQESLNSALREWLRTQPISNPIVGLLADLSTGQTRVPTSGGKGMFG